MTDDVVAIVLAGGRSRRMGRLVGPGGKAALEHAGESMLARVCRAVAGEAARVIVVAAAGQPLPRLPVTVEIVRDTRPAAGPLAALHDGLVHAGHGPRTAIVAPCDVPGLEPELVRLLVRAAREPGVRWAVPLVGGHPQVLVSALATDLVEPLAAALAAGHRGPRSLFEKLCRERPGSVRVIGADELGIVDPSLASFADIDAPEDLPGLDR